MADTTEVATPSVHQQLLALLKDRAPPEKFLALLAAGANASDVEAAITLRQDQLLQQRKENALLAVLETAEDLAALRDNDVLLHAIVRRARKLFDCDIAYLTNFDRERRDFYIRASDGAISEGFRHIRVPQHVGVCGQILRYKAPYHSGHYLQDAGFSHDLGIDEAVSVEGVRSLLGAPLALGEQVIGVLCLCDRQMRAYAPWEVAILSALAAQASIAIENSRLISGTQAALEEARLANRRLLEQAESIQTAADAHDCMTRLVAHGGSVEDMVVLVSEQLDAQAVFLDEGEQLLFRAAGGRSVQPQDPDPMNLDSIQTQDELHRALNASRISGRSQSAGSASAVRVAAVCAAQRLLGVLAVHTARPLTETQIRTLERAALVAGVMLLGKVSQELNASKEQAALLRALVGWNQERLSTLQPHLQRHRIDLARPVRILALRVRGRPSEFVLRRLAAPSMRGVLLEEYDGLLVAVAALDGCEALEATLEQLCTSDARLELTGVISSPIEDAREIPRRLRALQGCLRTMDLLDRRGEIAPEAALTMYALVFEEKRAQDVESFVTGTIGELVVYDARKRGDLCNTLLVFLDHAQSYRRTAEVLGIHVNTLRQRMETIQELVEHTFDRLEVHVALRLNHMLAQADAQRQAR